MYKNDNSALDVFELFPFDQLQCYFVSPLHTLYPGCNIFVYIADQKQPNTSSARMDYGKLTLFLLLQTLKRGVASQDSAEKHSVHTFMFRNK